MRKRKIALGAAMIFAAPGVGGVTAQAVTINEIAQSAVPVANEYGLYPSVMIAQALIESGSGQSQLASVYNNYFGVKWTGGQGIDLPTREVIDGVDQTMMQKFQVYGSVQESFEAHANLLRSSFYAGAWRENASSYAEATAALQGKYATDPNYANVLNSVIAQYDLTAFDGGYYALAADPTESSTATGGITVQEGDSFWSIAEMNGTSSAALMAANGLSEDSVLLPGQILQLPDMGSSTGGTGAQGGNYLVQEGDSFWSIAQANGVSIPDLMASNGLSENSTLLPGQRLRIFTSSNLIPSEGTGQSGGVYTVKAGDSLWSIAFANGMTADSLAALNGMGMYDMIQPGMTLSLGGQVGRQGDGMESGQSYTVQAGDSLWTIARTLGVSVEYIQEVNNITDANTLQIGEVLNF